MKRVLAGVLAAVLMLGLAGCKKEEKQKLTMGTGGTAGNYYAYGGVLAQQMKDHAGLDVSVAETEGSRANIQGMAAGDFQMAIAQSDVLAYAWQGRRDFDGARVDSLRTVAGLYAEPVQLIAVNPEIHFADELRGMRISVGAPGSGIFFNAMDLLDAMSLTLDDIVPMYLDLEQTVLALKAGTVDAAFITAGTPAPVLLRIQDQVDFTLVPIDGPVAERILTSCPFYRVHTIPAGTYAGQLQDVDTLAVEATLVVSADMDQQTVYQITQSIFDHMDAVRSCNPWGRELSFDTVARGITLPFHPGAEKYFAEQDVSLK